MVSTFFSDFCSFFFPSRADNSCINRTDTIVKISFFFLLSVSYIPNPYPIGLILAMCIYIYMLSGTRTCIQGGEERRMISSSVWYKAKLMSIITHILNKHFFFFFFFLLTERQKIILSENKFDYLIASIYYSRLSKENGI